jgi:lipoprotein-anchoring transpeptidase ErfK/SrfK
MRAALVAVGAALLIPAAAAAQTPVPTPTPTPTPVPPPPPKPAIAMEAAKVYVAGHDDVALRGKAYRLRGTMIPAVAGEKVTLAIHRNGKKIRTVRVPVAADGSFSRRMKTTRAGRYSVRASHALSPALAAARGPKVRVEVVEPRAADGVHGPLVRLLQRGLDKLAYAVPRNDSYDAATGRAVMAFRKVNGMPRRYDADRAVIEKVLAGKGAFKVRHPDAGHHVEADISRQVLALIDGGKVVDTYHTSTGAPATPTIIGSFRVYMKDPGINAKGMVKSSYFIRGYAIHGYVDVPAFNASHGCLRVPIPDAARIFNWVQMGDRVITYP